MKIFQTQGGKRSSSSPRFSRQIRCVTIGLALSLAAPGAPAQGLKERLMGLICERALKTVDPVQAQSFQAVRWMENIVRQALPRSEPRMGQRGGRSVFDPGPAVASRPKSLLEQFNEGERVHSLLFNLAQGELVSVSEEPILGGTYWYYFGSNLRHPARYLVTVEVEWLRWSESAAAPLSGEALFRLQTGERWRQRVENVISALLQAARELGIPREQVLIHQVLKPNGDLAEVFAVLDHSPDFATRFHDTLRWTQRVERALQTVERGL